MTNNLIDIKNLFSVLSSDKGPVYVLNDITLSVPKGKIIGLVGESGSGKTQLCMAIAGMQDLTPGVLSGEVNYNINNEKFNLYDWNIVNKSKETFIANGNIKRKNHNKFSRFITSHTKKIKQNLIGWIPQDPKTYLNPFWTIAQHFEESFKTIDDKGDLNNLDDFIKHYLKEVDLDYNIFKNKKPSELSGGEAQRLMIAFVLSKRPSFLIADESTTGLDVTRQKQVIDLFHKIRDKNKDLTMIIISHDFGVLDHLVDSYLVMYGGLLCEYIKNKDRIKDFKDMHPYSKDLIETLNPNYKKTGNDELSSSVNLNNKLKGCPYVNNCKILKEKPNLKNKCNNEIPKIFNIKEKSSLTSKDWIRCWDYE